MKGEGAAEAEAEAEADPRTRPRWNVTARAHLCELAPPGQPPHASRCTRLQLWAGRAPQRDSAAVLEALDLDGAHRRGVRREDAKRRPLVRVGCRR